MVRFLLSGARTSRAAAVFFVFLCLTPAWAAKINKRAAATAEEIPPDILMDGGRRLSFERTLSAEQEVRGKKGFWTKVLDTVAGEPDYRRLVRPYSIAVDSRGRIIVTDPGANGVHIFDYAQHKYKFLERQDKDKDPMLAPQCVAVDAQDNIYVTDSEAGKIFVFRSDGKFLHALGSLKGGEGLFKRPTGIAVDSAAQRIYVTDTLRDRIFVLSMNGEVLKLLGNRGGETAEFNYPTEILRLRNDLAVVDAMNFRVQVLDTSGVLRYQFGKLGDGLGQMFRPKGLAADSEGHVYVVEGMWCRVQVFDEQGRLLYYFGSKGQRLGEFQLPAGIAIDRDDRIYVVDSVNRRVQIFRYYGLSKPANGSMQ
jgi:DNA-binding beta-propeller fold protein YncE